MATSFLLVDDSKTMRMIVRRTIRQAGFEDAVITEAGDGAEALKLLETKQFDMILSDWNMIEVHGPDLLHRLNERKQATCFGFITSEGSEEMRRRAAELKARFLLAKPFSVDAFRDAVQKALASGPASLDAPTEVSPTAAASTAGAPTAAAPTAAAAPPPAVPPPGASTAATPSKAAPT